MVVGMIAYNVVVPPVCGFVGGTCIEVLADEKGFAKVGYSLGIMYGAFKLGSITAVALQALYVGTAFAGLSTPVSLGFVAIFCGSLAIGYIKCALKLLGQEHT